MGLFDELFRPETAGQFGAETLPTIPGAPSVAPPPTDPLALLLASLMKPQQRQGRTGVDLAALMRATRWPDPVGEKNRGYVPGVDNNFNPFSNGFFKNDVQRRAVEASRGEVGTAYGPVGPAGAPTVTLPGLSAGNRNFMDVRYAPRDEYGLPAPQRGQVRSVFSNLQELLKKQQLDAALYGTMS